jgi:dihydroflavonol-4-reductase
MVLVTGATGHIGNVLVRQLNTIGVRPRILVLKGESLEPVKGLEYEAKTGDICDPESLDQAFEGIDTVFHLAGLITIMPGRNKVVEQVNIGGTKNVIESCKKHGVKRLVYTSSIHALSRIPKGKAIDESVSFDPNNPYGAYDRSKAIASILVREANSSGLETVIACPTGVIGPYDFRISEMGRLIQDCISSRNLLYIDGAYDFVDVRDVASGLIQAWLKGLPGKTYILSGHKISVGNLIHSVNRFTNRKPLIQKIPLQLAKLVASLAPLYYRLANLKPRFTPYSIEVLQSNCDISNGLATRELGYATRPMDESLFETVRWFLGRDKTSGKIKRPIPVRSL